MKKNFIIALCALGMSMIVPTQMAFAKEVTDNDKPQVYYKITKENGRNILWGLCEERYKIVEYIEDEFFITNPETGEQEKKIQKTLSCCDPGWSLCRRPKMVGQKCTWRNVIISDEFLYNIENELLTDIDVEMIENHNFEGKKTKKVLVTEGNNQIVLFFVANWEQGDSDGNGIITIKVYDITDQIPTLY